MIFGVIGGGVVGQATKAYLESKGHKVRVYDPEPTKGTHQWHEVMECAYAVICVPTPGKEGRLDTSILDHLQHEIAYSAFGKPVIIRSTIPLGYTQKFEEMSGCPTIYWPEFLTERTAEEDALKPILKYIGYTDTSDQEAIDFACELQTTTSTYNVCKSDQLELIKLLSNTYGAVLVSLMNEFHSICEDNDVAWSVVRHGLLNTGRVLEVYSHVPGPDGKKGWGGKCWPKDAEEVMSMVSGYNSVVEAAVARNSNDRREV